MPLAPCALREDNAGGEGLVRRACNTCGARACILGQGVTVLGSCSLMVAYQNLALSFDTRTEGVCASSTGTRGYGLVHTARPRRSALLS